MPPKKKVWPTLRIGHLSITLLPGESPDRLQQITDEVWGRWLPTNIVEEFDCDMIIHARFKIERYQRFRDQFVASGIQPQDLDRAIKSYQSTQRTAERTLAIARETQPRVSHQMLADMPTEGPIQ